MFLLSSRQKVNKNAKTNYFSGNTCFFVFITDNFWRDFWCNNWRSIFDVIERLCLSIWRKFSINCFVLNNVESQTVDRTATGLYCTLFSKAKQLKLSWDFFKEDTTKTAKNMVQFALRNKITTFKVCFLLEDRFFLELLVSKHETIKGFLFRSVSI